MIEFIGEGARAMKTTTNRTGYPVIDEVLDSIAPTADHQHDYDPETGSCFCGDVWDESRDEQPQETEDAHTPFPLPLYIGACVSSNNYDIFDSQQALVRVAHTAEGGQ